MTETERTWGSAVYFKPFVGPDYKLGLADGKRVLLLGESHYTEDGETRSQGRDCTIKTFEDYLTCDICPGNRFWGKLQRIVTFNKSPTAAESNAAWHRVAYANFVQEFVGDGPRQRPTKAQWLTGQAALSSMIETLKPHAVLVLGSQTWNHITEGTASEEPPIQTPRGSRSIWQIPYDGGVAKATWLYHPATNYDSNETGISVLNSLMSRVAAGA